MNNELHNTTILCVDDELGVLESYKLILAPEADAFSEIMALTADRTTEDNCTPDLSNDVQYNLLLAESGEKAIKLVKAELAKGRRVAAGFFDMRMPGGIDGYETIKAIRALDSNIICTVVTAYTDRSVGQIRDIFAKEQQDELLYFKKPFAPEELEQGALNTVSSWNRKRQVEEYIHSIEKQKHGLTQILHAVSMLSRMPPHSLHYLISGLLFQLLAIVKGDDGFVVFIGADDSEQFSSGIGRFENHKDLLGYLSDNKDCQDAFTKNSVLVMDNSFFIPIVSGTKQLGGIYIEMDTQCHEVLDKKLLEVFRNQMVQLVLNSIFYSEIVEKDKEVVTDPLTGLLNRRFLMQRLQEELCRAARHTHRLAIIMLDLDDFKVVNDTFGHDAGDCVLKSIGNILRLSVRDYDLVGHELNIGDAGKFAIRFGGEEFCLILLQIEGNGAEIVGERIRKEIASHHFNYQDQTIRMTISIGISVETITPEKLKASDNYLVDMYKQADKALYVAKSKGKNRIEVFQE